MTDLQISKGLTIPEHELEFSAIRAQGPGGQNVNKVSSAVHLRFDVAQSSLPEPVKAAILRLPDRRLNSEGVLVIKAQRYRSQEKNRLDALQRLREIIEPALVKRKPRRPTKPSRSARRKRMDSKTRRGQTKALRGRVSPE